MTNCYTWFITVIVVIIVIIVESFYSLWIIWHPWRASKRCDLQLSPWPHSMFPVFLISSSIVLRHVLFGLPILYPWGFQSNALSLLLPLLYVICIQSITPDWLLLFSSVLIGCSCYSLLPSLRLLTFWAGLHSHGENELCFLLQNLHFLSTLHYGALWLLPRQMKHNWFSLIRFNLCSEVAFLNC